MNNKGWINERCRLVIEAGSKYGKLTVIKEAEVIRLPGGQINRAILCKCGCGNEKIVRLAHLIRGKITTCGCLRPKHGMTETSLYGTWRAMIDRCGNHTNIGAERYIDRGITVCEDWKRFIPFRDWALQNGWKEGLQIDRINNNGNYEPGNCRFVTNTVNVNNREITFRIKYDKKLQPFKNVMRDKNIPETHQGAIRRRIIRGWKPQRAIDTPIRKGNYKRNVQAIHQKFVPQ